MFQPEREHEAALMDLSVNAPPLIPVHSYSHSTGAINELTGTTTPTAHHRLDNGRSLTPSSLEGERVHTPFLNQGIDTPPRGIFLPGTPPTMSASLSTPETGSKRESGLGFQQDTGDEDSTRPLKFFASKGRKIRRGRYEYAIAGEDDVQSDAKRPRPTVKIFLIGIVVLILLAVAIVVPIYFTVIRHHSNRSNPTSNDGNGGGNNSTSSGVPNSAIDFSPLSGGSGSVIFDPISNTNFTYVNNFGGTYFFDPSSPFPSALSSPTKRKRDSAPFNGYSGPSAQAQSFTPPLNTSWRWGVDQVRGVNLGGWLVLEPFITPSLFQKYLDQGAEDEWSLMEAMRADTSDGGGLNLLVEHYESFITETDFAQIAGAGLNWIRLPVPFWAISTITEDPSHLNSSTYTTKPLQPTTPLNEPFLARVSFTYLLRALTWARKYGLRVLLEIHTAPGSQNGFNHSGRKGQINFLNGVMGIANAQRMVEIVNDFVEYFWGGGGEGDWSDVLGMFGLVNEPKYHGIGEEPLTNFYLHMHDTIRNITGFGEGKGPYIAIHDGFGGLSVWAGKLQGADRLALDTHPYFAFSGAPLTTPQTPPDSFPPLACKAFAPPFLHSQGGFGLTLAGEFSGSINDCGLFLLGPGLTPSETTYERGGGNCDDWTIWENWDANTKKIVQDFIEAQMDAMNYGGGWFFWTWKIGPGSDGKIRSPGWSYQLGLENGWLPADPRSASGKCSSLGAPVPTFDGTYSAWQTGGEGAGTVDASSRSAFGFWPPTTLNALSPTDVSLLPRYTNTGTGDGLPGPTITAILPVKSNVKVAESVGPGGATVTITPTWTNTGVGATAQPTTVSGCTYPNAWDAIGVPVPASAC